METFYSTKGKPPMRSLTVTVCQVIGLLLMISMLAGCGASAINVYVEANETANGGRPFFMVIRNIDQKAYLTESYEEVALKLFQDNEKSIVKTEIICPGTEKLVELELQDKLPMAIYFLFTDPGYKWKKFFPQPLPTSIEFAIEGNGFKEE